MKAKILFRAPDSMDLWAIPHGMRPGQSPGDLFREARDFIPPPYGVLGSKRPNLKQWGWKWLGTPGWWGDLPKEVREAVEAFKAEHQDLIPVNPYEWSDLEDEGVEFFIPEVQDEP